MKKGKDIDSLFREGLEHPDIPFNEAHWEALEERLHPKPKRRIAPLIWFTALSGVAAMLVIAFFLLKPNAQKPNDNAAIKNKIEQKQNVKPNADNKVKDEVTEAGGKRESLDKKVALAEAIKPQANHFVPNELMKTAETGNVIAPELAKNNNQLAASLLATNTKLSIENISQEAVFNTPKNTATDFGKPKEKVIVKNLSGKSRFVLSILAAPDLTSVEYSGRSNLSGSIGAELTFSLTKRLSVTTGAAYAKKIYESDFSFYNPNTTYVFKVEPSNIHANCDVLDIPLNVNYRIFDGNRNSITVSTGLSSYLMLKEKYNYTYNSSYAGPASYEVRNQNQHYLGVANIGVEFQHKINSKLSVSARPFMKLPLTDIGYGNTKLSSTGVAVSVNMNLFKRVN
ncbi:hypothetical protein [Pedobacter aquatilis]|uniref:hypothetical protein n=1 Tax=Pedobacter aquatilis TaxID=351343 RepID=UPI00292EA0A5|nr:hypothetical protein [Pedobacter aquatilis]